MCKNVKILYAFIFSFDLCFYLYFFLAEEFIVDKPDDVIDKVAYDTDAALFIPTLPKYEGKTLSRVGLRQGGAIMYSSGSGRQRLGLTGYKPVSFIYSKFSL